MAGSVQWHPPVFGEDPDDSAPYVPRSVVCADDFDWRGDCPPGTQLELFDTAGFKVAGRRAVRVDILERLADIIRPLIALNPVTHQGELPAGAAEGNGFRVTVEMTSLLGTAGEDFASILNSLGYRVRRTPKVVASAPEVAAEAAPDAPVEVAIGVCRKHTGGQPIGQDNEEHSIGSARLHKH